MTELTNVANDQLFAKLFEQAENELPGGRLDEDIPYIKALKISSHLTSIVEILCGMNEGSIARNILELIDDQEEKKENDLVYGIGNSQVGFKLSNGYRLQDIERDSEELETIIWTQVDEDGVAYCSSSDPAFRLTPIINGCYRDDLRLNIVNPLRLMGQKVRMDRVDYIYTQVKTFCIGTPELHSYIKSIEKIRLYMEEKFFSPYTLGGDTRND